MKCPMCGNETFESGRVEGHYRLTFKGDSASWLTRATIFGGRATRAKRCEECGFIAIFAK